jgi:putative Mg2+ transporter-C (MgtC) family protein
MDLGRAAADAKFASASARALGSSDDDGIDSSRRERRWRRSEPVMAMFHPVDLGALFDFCLRVGVAFVLATLIGAERQFRQRSAGLRTNVLVAVGAASFVSLGLRLNGQAGAGQIAAYVVSGIGFLGAGVIMKEGSQVWGLNTAATLWCSAAVGALCGVDLGAEAGVLTATVLAGNTLLRPLVNRINRAPLDEHMAEATYEVRALTRDAHVGAVRDLLAGELERANYPIREMAVFERGEDLTEVAATLVSTAVDPLEMDVVIAALDGSPLVSHASWSSSATD